jgi:hypothetical protein
LEERVRGLPHGGVPQIVSPLTLSSKLYWWAEDFK